MYASLDRADLAVEEEGGRIAIQTDHRTTDEIDAELDLAIVFALTRAINPLRSEQFVGVRFAFMSTPHPRLAEVLGIAGAGIEALGGGEAVEVQSVTEPDEDETDRIAAQALERIGRATLDRFGVDADAAGLRQLELQMYAVVSASDGVEDDPVGWWTAVVELGAATGEVIRALRGGHWARDPQNMTTVPFMLGRGQSLTNVFDKAERFFARGESEAPTVLLQILDDDEAEEGEVMFNLRPPDWGGREFAWCRPILDEPGAPLIALVHDLPNTTRSLGKDIPIEESQALEVLARSNLASLEVTVEPVLVADHEVLVTHRDFYAAEKLLDPEHLRRLQDQIGTEMMLASVPRKGVLFAMSAVMSSEATSVMLALTHAQFDDAAPNERLSRTVFLVDAGELVGVVRLGSDDEDEADDEPLPAAVDEDDPNPPTKGFWARLFGG